MINRLLTAASVLVILVVMTYFTTSTFSQSGRNRDARTARQNETPSLSTEDVPAAAPAAQAPVGHAPRPSTVARAAGPISWSSSFNDAQRTATADQVIFVDVYTDWCGWCKYMDQRVYTDTAVQQFAASHVFVKLDAEDGAEGTAFAQRMQVRGYPTLLVFSHDGRLLGAQPGAFRRAGDFLGWLQQTSAHQ